MNVRMSPGLRDRLNLLAAVWHTSQAGVIDELVSAYFRDRPELAVVAERPSEYGRPSQVSSDVNPDDNEDGGMPPLVVRQDQAGKSPDPKKLIV